MNEFIKRELLNVGDYGKYYGVPVYCDNCGKHDRIYMLMGKEKPIKVLCQNCGCNTAKT